MMNLITNQFSVSILTPTLGGVRFFYLLLIQLLWLSAACAAGWTTVTSQSTARYQHTATLLPNGQVLVAGGRNSSGSLASAELYDPIAKTWSPASNLSAARYKHTATLLPNGKVLVVGGYDGSSYLPSALLYDPASNTWAPASNLNTARRDHTATLLANGKVLVAGGFNGGYLPGAELYDPAANTWSPAGNLTARREHTATLLANGKVLVAGGFNGGYLPSAELFNPSANSWSPAGNLTTARNNHTATLLPTGKVLVAGGYGTSSYLFSAELYDPAIGASGFWTSADSLSTSRYAHSATLLPNGKVLVAGGNSVGGNAQSSAEYYDPANGAVGTWSSAGSLGTARYGHSATLLNNGKVLVVGGYDGTSYLSSAVLHDPATPVWSEAGRLNIGRWGHTATLLPDGKVLVAGGMTFPAINQASAELYDHANGVGGTWSVTGSMGSRRYRHTATLLANGKVLVVGGYDGSSYLSSAELYDPLTNTWSTTGSLSTTRWYHTATLLANGKVLVAGGFNGSDLSSAEIYDPATNSWSPAGNLNSSTATLLPGGKVLSVGYGDYIAELYDPIANTWSVAASLSTPRTSHTAILLPNGKVLVAGGYFDGDRLSGAELYNPATNTWSPAGSMTTKREDHTATLLANGKVLVAGGFNGSFLSSSELYDPTAGAGSTWSSAGNMGASFAVHTATLLPNGKVLVAGGSNSSDPLSGSGAWLFDSGLMYADSRRPTVATVGSLTAGSGGILTLTGTKLTGDAEGSSGNTQNSAANLPFIQLRRLDNEAEITVFPSSVSATTFTSLPMGLLPAGHYRLTVFSNGVPSSAKIIPALPSALPGAPTLLRLTPGNGSMRIEFSPPASTGEVPITSYTASCSGSGVSSRTATGTSSPITVTGLTNNVNYTCTVSATNSAGTGTASASASKVVRPASIAPILSILLD
ncbi:MAG: fibronectin type III domain-containing protein [Comamonadaceae bacterium]|nr:fibronectin type III domain-containing protein [Comamonadaceae bacterium]